MRHRAIILTCTWVAALAVMALPVRADLMPAGDVSALTVQTSRTAVATESNTTLGPAFAGELAEVLDRTAPTDSQKQAAVIQELPPAPGSAALFLSALASIGAYHIVRQARHLQLGAIPEWYHAEGPDQVGHSHVFDFLQPGLLPCSYDGDNIAPIARQWALPTIFIKPASADPPRYRAPRAPPLLATIA